MKKIFIIIFSLFLTLNFFSVTKAETLQEAIDAQKEAKQQKKQSKEISKAAKKANFQQVMAWAEAGDIQAQMILSYAYRHGLEVKHSYKTSDEWKEKAAKVNPVYVENFIPLEYYGKKLTLRQMYGIAAYRAQVGYYIKPDYNDAVRWAELGALENDPASLAYMGSAYYTGRGVKQDYKMAIDYFKKSLQEPLSLQLLSDAYAKGNGVEQDTRKSKIYADYLKFVQQPKIDKLKERNLKKIELKNRLQQSEKKK